MAAETSGRASARSGRGEDEFLQGQACSVADRAIEVDTNGYSFMLWTAAGQEAVQVGDDVFVSLRSDKETGKARVVQDRITDPDSPYKGRIKVEYYDGSGTYHVRPSKMVKVLQTGSPLVVIVPETDDMRTMARSQLEPGDTVVDIGSSYGVCTEVLAKHCKGNVLGIEISADLVHEARRRYPHIEFIQMDALLEQTRLKQACSGANTLFLDLGGDRPMEAVVTLLPFLQKEVHPRLIVIKNRELARFAAKHIIAFRADGCSETSPSGDSKGGVRTTAGPLLQLDRFWENVELHCLELERARESREPRPHHLENHDGVAPVRFVKYPLDYKQRDNGLGIFICRYHNYGVCTKSCTCPFDHNHCHQCGQEGHIAKNCLIGLPADCLVAAAGRQEVSSRAAS